ncbi:hypothetical protein Agub_g5893, partial [Astrephomene gubernaculifera]
WWAFSMTALSLGTSARCMHTSTARRISGAPLLAYRRLLQSSTTFNSNLRGTSLSLAPQRKLMSESAGPGDAAKAVQDLSSASGNSALQQDFLVQYVVVRKDLWGSLGWPLGSVVAQACHASSAAMWQHRDEEATQKYLAPDNIDHMRKVVLEVKDESQLRRLSEQLTQAGVGHKMWIEQPENFPTCLATRPYAKSQVAAHFKKLQLCKAPIG